MRRPWERARMVSASAHSLTDCPSVNSLPIDLDLNQRLPLRSEKYYGDLDSKQVKKLQREGGRN